MLAITSWQKLSSELWVKLQTIPFISKSVLKMVRCYQKLQAIENIYIHKKELQRLEQKYLSDITYIVKADSSRFGRSTH